MENVQGKVGARIRAFRLAKGSSIEELADIACMNAAQLGKIERGERNFTIGSLNRIVEALGVNYRDLFDFETKVEPETNPYIQKTVLCLRNLTVDEQEHVYKTAKLLAEREP